MQRPADATAVRAALAQRLRAAATVLLSEEFEPSANPAADAATILHALVGHVRSSDGTAATWLLLVAISGTFPDDATVRATRRRLELDTTADGMLWLLDLGLAELRATGAPLTEIDVVVDAVLVDVDFSSRNDLNTGIQRVVRSTVPIWEREHDITLVSWTASGAFRALGPDEEDRVLRWSGTRRPAPARGASAPRVIVPWQSVLVLPEVPGPDRCTALASLAEHSGTAVSAIGYDFIPVVSADLMPPVEPRRFVRYLTIIKHSRRVSGISASASAEFRGFVHMLPAQGLAGPEVSECTLPVEIPASAVAPPVGTARELPLVLVVGSHEPRKNHLAVLHASEVLWREGLKFRLEFIGGSSWASAGFDSVLRSLRRRGRPVSVGRGVTDNSLWKAYRAARFTVFPSLHEGFGLPVAESLAVGTPAITSNIGSMAQIAHEGGAIMIDPRDDEALASAMRLLLTDDERLAALTAEAHARPPRTWSDYARELWTQLVEKVEVSA
ncbi:glycosyltransferase [Pengzhenrongella sicca]|uniref:Glycosyltransferase n=1 Tax=Pengzhenrongella sicca TaxID=2819238 RepID=A0A8A4ZGX5_9MICO|nr:glycosyltransferase [Pengzhenrongella sicca]QTE30239.1 glycosyltransferase [Pengzhenrongella sicca]